MRYHRTTDSGGQHYHGTYEIASCRQAAGGSTFSGNRRTDGEADVYNGGTKLVAYGSDPAIPGPLGPARTIETDRKPKGRHRKHLFVVRVCVMRDRDH